jgi:hypothetical protein
MKDIPAFPIVVDYGDGVKYQTGMTLRDYFAVRAMQSIRETSKNTPYEDIAKCAYQIADAMMKARE